MKTALIRTMPEPLCPFAYALLQPARGVELQMKAGR
jgi:hypothetical protein